MQSTAFENQSKVRTINISWVALFFIFFTPSLAEIPQQQRNPKTNFSEGSLEEVRQADLFCIFPCRLLQSPDMHLICTCATLAFRHPRTLPPSPGTHPHSRQMHSDMQFYPIMMTLLFYCIHTFFFFLYLPHHVSSLVYTAEGFWVKC